MVPYAHRADESTKPVMAPSHRVYRRVWLLMAPDILGLESSRVEECDSLDSFGVTWLGEGESDIRHWLNYEFISKYSYKLYHKQEYLKIIT